MCTATTYIGKDFYFGRTYDNDCSYIEEVVITPRRKYFDMRYERPLCAHNAMIGIAHVEDGYPLYYDAVNEKGLCMAGLNFVGNAEFFHKREGACNIAVFEFIPWILGQCATVAQARRMLEHVNLTETPFNDKLPVARLHWIIADKAEAVTVESTADGLHVYDNCAGVLTNNPIFPMQTFALNNYMALSAKQPTNGFCKSLDLKRYSNGMGAIGLPGDLSSQSRFVRAAFTKLNATRFDTEAESVAQFFHILGAVEQTDGCCVMESGKNERTIYTSCINADKGLYYYKSYTNSALTCVDMHKVDLDGSAIVRYPLLTDTKVNYQN